MILPSILVFFALLLMGSSAENYPNPHMVIVGPTGSGKSHCNAWRNSFHMFKVQTHIFEKQGKSSLANALLGCGPWSDDCEFNVCNGFDSCTKNTSIGTGQWLGVADGFSVRWNNCFM